MYLRGFEDISQIYLIYFICASSAFSKSKNAVIIALVSLTFSSSVFAFLLMYASISANVDLTVSSSETLHNSLIFSIHSVASVISASNSSTILL